MSSSEHRKTTGKEMRPHRDQMRALGLKEVSVWVRDRNSPEFIAEARRQSDLIAASPMEAEDQAFVDAISDFTDWK